MRNILSQSLINELDELDQLTSSVLHGNKTRKNFKATSICNLFN